MFRLITLSPGAPERHCPEFLFCKDRYKPFAERDTFISPSLNGIYSLKWRLTDRYLRWGTLADLRPGLCRSVQIEGTSA